VTSSGTLRGCPAGNPGSLVNNPTPDQVGSGGIEKLAGVDVNSPSDMPVTLDPTKYYYDSNSGMLYLMVQQTQPNTQNQSPLGSCPGNQNCPPLHFYSCPAAGCFLYTVRVTDGSYKPGTTRGPATGACMAFDSTGKSIYHPEKGGWNDYPANMDQLAYIVPSNAKADDAALNFLDSGTKNGASAEIDPVPDNAVGGAAYPYNNPAGPADSTQPPSGSGGRPWCPVNTPTDTLRTFR